MFSLARWVFGTLIAAIIFSLGRSGEEAEGEEAAQRPVGFLLHLSNGPV